MRIVIMSIAFLTMALGAWGLVSPQALTAFRRRRLETRRGLYVTPVFRVAVGLLLIVFAPSSRRRTDCPGLWRIFGVFSVVGGVLSTVFQGSGGRIIQRRGCL